MAGTLLPGMAEGQVVGVDLALCRGAPSPQPSPARGEGAVRAGCQECAYAETAFPLATGGREGKPLRQSVNCRFAASPAFAAPPPRSPPRPDRIRRASGPVWRVRRNDRAGRG